MTDWQSLSDQLKALGVELGKNKQFHQVKTDKYPIEEVVSGRYWDGIYGQVFCHEAHFPEDHCHGTKSLRLAGSISTLCRWADAENLSLKDIQDFIFLDTETSGLAGGTGTYAFEVGLGRFKADGFHLAQFFMRHPGEEPALLAGLTEFMDGMKAVVTYNGKSFDIPLLNTRYTMMGLTSPFTNVEHFDLLPLARWLWRDRLESRTLSNVENKILGVNRGEEEVPGYLIPEMYFDYLKTQDARPMAGIFYHNEIDILSLAGLFSHMAELLHDPHTKNITYCEDRASLARFFESQGDIDQAKPLYRNALKSDLPETLYQDLLQRFSFLLKRQNDWDSAVILWEEAADQHALYAFEELAKYYEHRVKDLETARQWTLRGIQALQTQHLSPFHSQLWEENLAHRLNRLEQRLARLDLE